MKKKVIKTKEMLLDELFHNAQVSIRTSLGKEENFYFYSDILGNRLYRSVEQLFNNIGTFIRDEISNSIVSGIQGYLKDFKKATGREILQYELDRLIQQVEQEIRVAVFKGNSLGGRVKTMENQLKETIKEILKTQLSDGKKVSNIILDVKEVLEGTVHSWAKQLLISECNRAVLEIGRAFGIYTNAKQANWITSKNHQGEDICDELAKGTYSMDEIPEYPHPGCGCSIQLKWS